LGIGTIYRTNDFSLLAPTPLDGTTIGHAYDYGTRTTHDKGLRSHGNWRALESEGEPPSHRADVPILNTPSMRHGRHMDVFDGGETATRTRIWADNTVYPVIDSIFETGVFFCKPRRKRDRTKRGARDTAKDIDGS
jgi:hypothetical protein